MTHRCDCCGTPQPDDPVTAVQERADRAIVEYRRRWGSLPADGTTALTALAESRGLSLLDVVEAAAHDELGRVVQLPVVRRSAQ